MGVFSLNHQDQARVVLVGRGIGLPAISLFVCLLLFCVNVCAEESSQDPEKHIGWKIAEWRLQTSLYTHHWSYNPDHNDHQHLVDIEAVFENNWIAGGSFFYNSFGQPSEFVYMAYQWPLLHSEHWYFQLAGGLLYGYKDPYQDKIPLNGLGIAPAIIPIIGFRYKWAFSQLLIEGTAAITVTAGFAF